MHEGKSEGQEEHDAVFIKEQPQINPEALNEGLYVLVQTGKCQ